MPDAPTPSQEDHSLTALYLQIVQSRPDELAVLSASENLSYRELHNRAVVVAQALRRLGVERGTLVGLYLPRSTWSMVAVLGTLLAGGAYVPIDPNYPPDRQRFLLHDSEVKVVITCGSLVPATVDLQHHLVLDLDTLAGAAPEPGFVPTESAASDLLYVLYTSGSTGRPNGVCGTHRATLNRLRWGFATFPFDRAAGEVVAHRSSLNFVDSVAEIFSGLLSGVPTALLSHEEVSDLHRLIASLRHFAVTRLTVVPTVLAALLRATPSLERALPRLLLWTSSGEELSLSLLQHFRAAHPSATMINIYGSTEVTADVTYVVYPPEAPLPSERVPIGAAMADAELLILTENLAPVPDGQSGELYVGGPVLSRGYLRRPVEQARRFVPHPLRPGELLFRTGDRVRRGSDGLLYYLGRQDNQVKLNGVRIELEEIERVLTPSCPGLRELAVVVHEEPDQPLSRRLCAFYAPEELDPAPLRAAASRLLPASMLPTEYLGTPRLPLLPNGKLDRKTLTEWARRSTRELRPEDEPQTDTEKRLAALFAAVLGRNSIARQDTFADLGGSSLALAELLVGLDRDFCSGGLESQQVYQHPLHEIASWLDGGEAPKISPTHRPGFELHLLTPARLGAEQAILLAAKIDEEREPLTAATNLTIDDQVPYVSPIVHAGLAEGLSFLAQAAGTQQILGFCLAHDYCTPAGISLSEASPRLRPTIAILTELEDAYVHLRGQPAPGEVIQLAMTGTVPGVAGYEIARQLELRAMETARLRGYRRAVTICTNRVTSIQALRAGFVQVDSRPYATYEFEGKRFFAAIAEVHHEAVLFEKEL